MKRSDIVVGGLYRAAGKYAIIAEMYEKELIDGDMDTITEMVGYMVIKKRPRTLQKIGKTYYCKLISFTQNFYAKCDFELNKLQLWYGYP